METHRLYGLLQMKRQAPLPKFLLRGNISPQTAGSPVAVPNYIDRCLEICELPKHELWKGSDVRQLGVLLPTEPRAWPCWMSLLQLYNKWPQRDWSRTTHLSLTVLGSEVNWV